MYSSFLFNRVSLLDLYIAFFSIEGGSNIAGTISRISTNQSMGLIHLQSTLLKCNLFIFTLFCLDLG